jgi:hypothetical protein
MIVGDGEDVWVEVMVVVGVVVLVTLVVAVDVAVPVWLGVADAVKVYVTPWQM